MKSRTVAVLLIFVLVPTFAASAQKKEAELPRAAKLTKPAKIPAVKTILDRHIKALGGGKAIAKLRSRVSTGTIEMVPMNLKGTFEIYAAAEAKSYTKMTIAGIGDLIEASDGMSAWSKNPLQGDREKSGAELAQAKLINDFYRDLRLDKLYSKITVRGIEKVAGKDAYVLVADAEGIPSETWYFDVKSGLMLRSDVVAIAPEGQQKLTNYYEDFRPVDGVLVPHRIRSETAGFTIILTSTEIKHGVPVDESKFKKP